MQNAKLGILATIGLVGLSILAGCQQPAKAPSMAKGEKASTPAATAPPPAPVGKRLGIVLHGTTSSPSSVTLNPNHNERIVWVAPPNENMEVVFNSKMGSPFVHGSPNAPDNTYEVPEGQAILSGPLKPGIPDGTYPYVVTTRSEGKTATKDGDVIIRR